MKAEGLVKQEHIVEAAIKRFSHFGINKTTLTEIAEDLSISKTSLFYYFQDKNSLITAVATKIFNEFLEELEASFRSAASTEEGLYSLIELKRSHVKKYHLLAIQGENIDLTKFSAAITPVYMQAREKSVLLLSNYLQKGISEKVFKPMDTLKTTHILLETLSAYEYCFKKTKSLPEPIELDEMFDKQAAVLDIFLNGLKTSEWKN
jgi:AcrR family transcriptional regulator